MKKWVVLLVSVMLTTLSAVEYRPKNFDQLYEKMPKINKGLLEIHFQLYRGYVKQVNLLNRLLEEQLAKPHAQSSFMFQSIKRQFGWEFNGMVLHELYFDNLGSSAKLPKNSILMKKITEQWGNYEKWFDEFKETCKVRGIGWAILYYDHEKDALYNCWVSDHDDGPLVNAAPLLVIDLWEHAYLCQFGTNRERYIDTIFEYVDWRVVNRRLRAATSSQKAREPRQGKQLQERQLEKSVETQ